MERLVRVIRGFEVYDETQRQDSEALQQLFEDLIESNVPLFKRFENSIYLERKVLDDFFANYPDHLAKELFNNKYVCPVCGIEGPYTLRQDYRDLNSYVIKYISCDQCMYMDNDSYFKLMNHSNKQEYVRTLFEKEIA